MVPSNLNCTTKHISTPSAQAQPSIMSLSQHKPLPAQIHRPTASPATSLPCGLPSSANSPPAAMSYSWRTPTAAFHAAKPSSASPQKSAKSRETALHPAASSASSSCPHSSSIKVKVSSTATTLVAQRGWEVTYVSISPFRRRSNMDKLNRALYASSSTHSQLSTTSSFPPTRL